jgi:hypothetical protein
MQHFAVSIQYHCNTKSTQCNTKEHQWTTMQHQCNMNTTSVHHQRNTMQYQCNTMQHSATQCNVNVHVPKCQSTLRTRSLSTNKKIHGLDFKIKCVLSSTSVLRSSVALPSDRRNDVAPVPAPANFLCLI